jgi:hypothetical protein
MSFTPRLCKLASPINQKKQHGQISYYGGVILQNTCQSKGNTLQEKLKSVLSSMGEPISANISAEGQRKNNNTISTLKLVIATY